MDNEQAAGVLAEYLATYRAKSSVVLKELVGQTEGYDVAAPDYVVYQIKVQVFWDNKPDGDIRVMGAIDDGGWRAFIPLCDDFIMAPDGSFVDE